MDKTKTFRFAIEMPHLKATEDGRRQLVHAHARFPHLVYNIELMHHEKMGHRDQIEFAVNELKIKLCQEILNAELEYEKE